MKKIVPKCQKCHSSGMVVATATGQFLFCISCQKLKNKKILIHPVLLAPKIQKSSC